MATVSKWTPFGVALDVTATAGTVTRKSATQYTVVINVSWETYYSGAQTNYGMTAASGGVTHTISAFNGTKRSSGSGSFTGTYSISGNGSASKTVTVTFRNFNTDNGDSATKNVSFTVNVPAWTSYTVSYNANGGSGAPGSQTKWKDQTLTLSSTKPTRTGHSFLGWSTSSTATSATYSAGGNYTANAGVTLYAVWKANTYTVSYNANGGTGAPGNQTKTYGKTLTLSTTKPTRTNYNFKGWGTSASATTVAYASGASYTANAAITLYAVWELAYKKPRIGTVSSARCDSNGTANDEGQNGLITFNWECDKTVTSIVIKYKLTTSTSWTSVSVTASGTKGTVNQVIGSNGLDIEKSYDVHITVSDGNGSSYTTSTITSMKFMIDIKSGGNGIAFGKTAELDGVAEFAYEGKFNKPVYGKVLGMDRVPNIPTGADLNDYLDPGCYAINWNDEATNISCGGVKLGSTSTVPPAKACRFEVWSSTGYGLRSNQHLYLKQRFIPFGSEHPTWERDIDVAPDGTAIYYSWFRSTLTPTLSNRIYHEQNVLATTGMLFTAGHSITLSEPVSKQMHGIVLVFSAYIDLTVNNYDFVSYYVPKELIAELPGRGHSFPLMRIDCTNVGVKFLYIDDTRVWGDDRNQGTGTGSDINYSNNKFVLRYVYGV